MPEIFTPMPGYDSGMMAPPVDESEIRRQREEVENQERQRQAKAFASNYAAQRAAAAEGVLQEITNRQSQSPLNIKVKADPSGVSSLGGQLTIPLSQRIGFTAGGAYAPGRAVTGDVMGQQTNIQSPGQFAARAGYRSPFMNVDLEYSPRSSDPFGNPMGGFSGMGSVQGRW